jgi:hypothetical protein
VLPGPTFLGAIRCQNNQLSSVFEDLNALGLNYRLVGTRADENKTAGKKEKGSAGTDKKRPAE